MTDNVMLGVIAGVTSVVGVGSPLLLSVLTSRQQAAAKVAEAEVRMKEKEQEYARLDQVAAKAEERDAKQAAQAAEVARQAAEAAELLRKQQMEVASKAAEAARLLLQSNQEVANTAKVTNGKLDIIHTLVNSNMTAAMEDALEALKAQLVLMQEVIDLKRTQGKDPSPETLVAMETIEKKISDLQIVLIDRRKQAKVVADKEANARSTGVPIEKGEDGTSVFFPTPPVASTLEIANAVNEAPRIQAIQKAVDKTVDILLDSQPNPKPEDPKDA